MSPPLSHLVLAAEGGEASQSCSRRDPKQRFKAPISKPLVVDFDSLEDDNVALADVLRQKF